MLARSPGFIAVTVFTLALGIGATTAIFSVVYGVLLRPLPYSQPDRIVELKEVNDQGGRMNFADPNFEDVRAQNHSLQGVAEYNSGMESVAGASEPTRTMVASVSRDFFPLMRVQPVLGRGFAPEDQRFGTAPVALVSYAYWKQYLGGTTDLAKVKLTFENKACSVIGVLPPGFRFPEDSDIWVPRELFERLPSRTAHNWSVVGRLRDGISLTRARAELTGIGRRLKQQYGRDEEYMMRDVAVFPLRESLTREVRPALLILLGAVGFLLLVACANVANLLLAQAMARERELAIRVALGAGRERLLRQFITEALLLSITGGLLGVLAALWGLDALLALAPPNLPRLEEVSISLPVLLFAFAVSVAVALGLGIFTALRASGGDVQGALVERGQGQVGTSGGRRVGRVIAAAQLAITLVLLVGAGLLGRSLLRVLSVNPGFRTEHILTMGLALPPAFEDKEKVRRQEFLTDLISRLRALPGVREAGGTGGLPLLNGSPSNGTFVVMEPQEGLSRTIEELQGKNLQERLPLLTRQLDELFRGSAQKGEAVYCPADEGYFRALGIPLLSGRLFDNRDTFDSPPVALISQSLARQQWLREDPVGQTIEFGNIDGDLRLLTVVGVVGDVRQDTLEAAPAPTIYVNIRQRPQHTYAFTAVLRTDADPTSVISAARQLVRELDPNIPPSFRTFLQIFSASLMTRRFNLTLVGVFAASALLLAAAGIYGVMAYSVAQRTREFGVRIALGANARDVVRLVLGQAVMTAAAGVAAGLAGSLALTRVMQSLLFEVSATDPLTFAGVAVLLSLVALVASYIPARRATKVDPMVALRYE
jgi:ABC-type antimicrobial peptide transport system permease subunit